MLRSNDVHCTPVILSTPEETPSHRLGTSVIKHTIHGDANITDDARAIKEIMNMNFDIKR